VEAAPEGFEEHLLEQKVLFILCSFRLVSDSKEKQVEEKEEVKAESDLLEMKPYGDLIVAPLPAECEDIINLEETDNLLVFHSKECPLVPLVRVSSSLNKLKEKVCIVFLLLC